MGKIDPSDPPIRTQCNLAGVTHRQKVLKKLPEKTRAGLLREPDNRYDSNAIAVYVDGKHVGYVPKEEAAWMSSVMDVGEWTFACPYMRISWWDEGGIYTASLMIERRRPGPDIIGSEHLPKPARHQARQHDEIEVEDVPSGRPSFTSTLGILMAWGLSKAIFCLVVFSKLVAKGTRIAVSKADEQIVRMAGDDTFMRYFLRFVACLFVFLLSFALYVWLY